MPSPSSLPCGLALSRLGRLLPSLMLMRAPGRLHRCDHRPAAEKGLNRGRLVDRTGAGSFTCVMTEVAAGLSRIAVLTSGGDAGGMNPAIRAVVRTAVHHGIAVYAVADGYHGLIQGGDAIRRVESADAGGILQRGGTILGTARSTEFQQRDGAPAGRAQPGGAAGRGAGRDRR